MSHFEGREVPAQKGLRQEVAKEVKSSFRVGLSDLLLAVVVAPPKAVGILARCRHSPEHC